MLKRIAIKWALKVLKLEVMDNIQYAPAAGITALAFSTVERAANIVLDNDPNNKAQFAALWQEEKKNILVTALATTKAVIVEEVENERTEGYIVGLLDEIQQEVEAGNILKIAA
jgi:hypothetical protein